MGHQESISKASWPKYFEEALVRTMKTAVYQIDGKLKLTITVSAGTTKADAIAYAIQDPKLQKYQTYFQEEQRVIFKDTPKMFLINVNTH